MSAAFKEGDRVQIVDRAATADDVKSGLFYDYFRGLTGTVQKLYAEEVAIEVEPEALTESVSHRHADFQEQMKTKWLDGLSDEARNRLSDQEKDFRLRYTVLVGIKDLTAPQPGARPKAVPADASVSRPTTADIEAAEEAELRRRQQEAGN